MLIVSVDTSGRNGGLALARGDAMAFEVVEFTSLEGGQYSAQLVPALAASLTHQGLTKHDIDAFAVATGPGSFTGLRVGIATVKGLAEIFAKPIAGVSVLEAMATSAGAHGRVIAALDAGRREVYVGEYDVSGDAPAQARCVSELLLPHAAFEKLLAASPAAELITAEENVAELARLHTRVKRIERPDARVIARLGLAKIIAGEPTPVEALEANYIRPSDAELMSKRDA